jgi:hypothetical protein
MIFRHRLIFLSIFFPENKHSLNINYILTRDFICCKKHSHQYD